MWSLGFTGWSGSAENEQMTLDIMPDPKQPCSRCAQSVLHTHLTRTRDHHAFNYEREMSLASAAVSRLI